MLSPYQSILDKLTYTETLNEIWKIAVDFLTQKVLPMTVDHHIKLAPTNLQTTTREQAIARTIIKRIIVID